MPIVDLDPQPIGAPLTTPQGAFVTPGLGDIEDKPREVAPITLGERALGVAASVVPGGSLFYNVARGPAFAPAMRRDNLLASVWSSESAWTDRTPDPDFNPFDHIKGTKYEQFPESFIGVRNQRQFTATQRDIDREEEDNKNLASLPWYQTLPASLLANVLDPTVVLPGGGFYRSAKGGFSFLRTAASVGAGAGAQSAVQEAGLQAIQETRTGTESALNIGSSVLLGSLLGWGGAAILSRGEMRSAIAAVDRQLGAMGDDATAIIEDLQPKLVAAGRSADEAAVEARIVAARYGARAERLGAPSALDLYQGKVDVRAGEFDPATMALPDAERQFFQSVPTFYSAVLRSVETAKQEKAPAAQWLGTLKNTPGVKPEEMEWLGLENWLKEQKGPVTKQAIADYVRANQIEVREVEKAERRTSATGRTIFQDRDEVAQRLYQTPYDKLASEQKRAVDDELASVSPTKFGSYTLPGGENYRELLLTLPSKAPDIQKPELVTSLPEGYQVIRDSNAAPERRYGIIPPGQTHARSLVGWHPTEEEATRQALNHINSTAAQHYDRAVFDAQSDGQFRSSHFDEPNILAHVRFNDRTIAGKKTLFLEEIQSDFGQAFRREQTKVAETVDRDFDTIADAMVKAGVIEKICD